MESVNRETSNFGKKLKQTAEEFLDELVERTGSPLGELAQRAGYEERTLKRVRTGEIPLSERMQKNLVRAAALLHDAGHPEEFPKMESGARAKLAAALAARNMTPADLAKKIGYDAGVIQYTVNGSGRASESMIERIVRVLPELTKEELMGGSDVPKIISEVEGTYGAKPIVQLPPGMRGRVVPLISMAQAGAWDAAHSDELYQYEGVFALNVDDRRAFAIRVSGNSMEPEVCEGDVVVCSPSKQPTQGACVVVRTHSGQAFIKFWKCKGEDVVLESANPAYKPIQFPLSEIAGAWPVVQKIQSGLIEKK